MFLPVTNISVSIPAAIASYAAYWMRGLSTMGGNSFGIALVAGRKRVPNPATGKTALRNFMLCLPVLDDNITVGLIQFVS